jgi:hypothetical protein
LAPGGWSDAPALHRAARGIGSTSDGVVLDALAERVQAFDIFDDPDVVRVGATVGVHHPAPVGEAPRPMGLRGSAPRVPP